MENCRAGRGYSSLAIVDGKIFTLGDAPSTADDKDEYLVCFNQADGKQLWKTKTGPAYNEGQPNWQSSRSTPTVDGDRVYVITPLGMLICCKTTGEELWRHDLKKDFEGKKAEGWGYSESVTIDGDKLVCTPGGPTNTMVALDKITGEKRWSAARPKTAVPATRRSSSPTSAARASTCNPPAAAAMGVRASDGKLLWTFDIDKTTAVIPTPIVRDDLVFFDAGYNRGGALLKQVPGADGDIKIETIYPLKPELATNTAASCSWATISTAIPKTAASSGVPT